MTDLLLWLDLETTGLDPDTGAILEIACIVTTMGGERCSDVFQRQCGFTGDVSNAIAVMHGGPDGLLAVCRGQASVGEADIAIDTWLGDRRGLILAGSSIHFDRRWIDRHMPRLADHLHYRMLDVRSVLMTLKAAGREFDAETSPAHRAGPDMVHALAMYQRALEAVRP